MNSIEKESTLLPFSDKRLSYDFLTHKLIVGEEEIKLQPFIDKMLLVLLLRAGRLVRYETLRTYERPTYLGPSNCDNALAEGIWALRTKLDLPETHITDSCIQTIDTYGYKYIPDR